jgi:hypothetical protein
VADDVADGRPTATVAVTTSIHNYYYSTTTRVVVRVERIVSLAKDDSKTDERNECMHA